LLGRDKVFAEKKGGWLSRTAYWEFGRNEIILHPDKAKGVS
jgi:hypothetical protein